MKKLQIIIIILVITATLFGCTTVKENHPVSSDVLDSSELPGIILWEPDDTAYPDNDPNGIKLPSVPVSEIIPDSSSRLLTDNDLADFDYDTLRLAKNEIFARHGYVFKDSNISNYFNSLSWYTPDPTFSGRVADLTYVEQKNVTRIESKLMLMASSNFYILPESSTRRLTDADVNCLDTFTIWLAKNEIFARHGYVFKDYTLITYFKNVRWYVQDHNFSGDIKLLSKIEQYNVNFLDTYWDKHTKKSYSLQTVTFDLDGNGSPETITAEYTTNYDGSYSNMSLSVKDINGNTTSIRPTSSERYSNFQIAKFSVTNTHFQLFFTGESASDYYALYVYSYMNGKLVEEGISGYNAVLESYDGSGLLNLTSLSGDYVNCEFYFDKGVIGLPKSNIVGKTIDAGIPAVRLYSIAPASMSEAMMSHEYLDNPNATSSWDTYADYFVGAVSGQDLKVLDWVLGEDGRSWTMVRAVNGKEGWYSIYYGQS